MRNGGAVTGLEIPIPGSWIQGFVDSGRILRSYNPRVDYVESQNLPFQQILPTFILLLLWTVFTITGPDRTYHASRSIFSSLFLYFFMFDPCVGLSWLRVSYLLHVKYTLSYKTPPWLVGWHSGRTLVFDRRSFPVLRSTCSWRVTTYVGKPSAIGQPTRPTQPLSIRSR